MALPKLNAHINYKMKIPSTGQMVEYRPYLVKEEKVMMQAMESNDRNIMLDTLAKTIEACLINSDVNVRTLTMFDIDYMFLKIRARSVGETTEVGLKCAEDGCETSTPITINFDDIKPPTPKGKKGPYIVELTDDVHLELKFPSYGDLQRLISMPENTDQVEASFTMVRACLSAIMQGDNRFMVEDHTEEEISDFISNFTSGQFKMIQDFINTIPELTHEVKWVCEGCGAKNKEILKGTADFFQ